MRALEVSEDLGGFLKGDPAAEFSAVDDIKGCKKRTLSFVSEPVYLQFLKDTQAVVLVVEKSLSEAVEIDNWLSAGGRACVFVDKSYRAFIKIIYKLHPVL